MATIAEMNSKMTIYYSKSTGEIKRILSGIHDMTAFDSEMSLIWDFLAVDRDEFILTYMNKFLVQDGQVKIKPDEIPNYTIAT